jgi:hypothetical protein
MTLVFKNDTAPIVDETTDFKQFSLIWLQTKQQFCLFKGPSVSRN